MREVDRRVIPTNKSGPIRSLSWQGDTLVDWAGGGTRYLLDGTVVPRLVNYAYVFDRQVISRDGRYAVIFHNLGTKGLLLKESKVVREINRSFYHANVYDYPVTFMTLPSGSTALVHCPNEYWRLEIEEVESGQSLSKRKAKFVDFFQSRLVTSADGRYLVSAGWIWHPFNDVWVYDLQRVLKQPKLLDQPSEYRFGRNGVGVNAAAFREDNALVVTTNDEWYDEGDVERDEEHLLPPDYIGVYDLDARRFRLQAPLEEVAGTIMPVGDFAVGFYKHPKLISLASGEVVHRWDDLSSGEQTSSIVWHHDRIPPLALDSRNMRFAVASEQEITVIQLG
jgi:hypothetical protein